MKLNRVMLLALLLAVLSSHAQDKIFKKDGEVINAKVKTVGTTTIVYKRADYADGPEYTILKREVSQVKYENGTTDVFDREDGRLPGRGHSRGRYPKGKFVKLYGDNIISIIPAAYTVSMDGTINDAGIGINYERQLDERGHFSFNMPVIASFSTTRDFTDNSFYYTAYYNPNATYKKYTSYSFMPGVKFYPATSREKVRYSLGASFFATFGKEPYAIYDNNNNYYTATGTYPTGDWKYNMYGFMLSNSVNIMAGKHVQMAVDLNLGIPFSDNRREENDNTLDPLAGPWMQFALKIGYRF